MALMRDAARRLDNLDDPAAVLVVAGLEDGLDGGLLSQLAVQPGLRLTPSHDLGSLAGQDALLALSAGAPLDSADRSRLERFIIEGGTAVILGHAADGWCRERPWLGVAAARERGPSTELRVRIAAHPLTARLEASFMVHDRLRLDTPTPPDSEPLLTVDWHLTQITVAHLRRLGAGVLVYIGLDELDSSAAPGNLARLIRRCLRSGGLAGNPHPIGVGLLGYGAIGREHGAAVAATEGLSLTAVCDLAREQRERARAELPVPVHSSAERLLSDSSVEVVVIGTPPDRHARLAMRSLGAGRHVVVDKPLALRALDADRMIGAARAARRVLTVYQNRRWDPDFVALRGTVEAGSIGEPFHVEMFVGGWGHPCSLWHSHQAISGGTLFDWGAHYLDWILLLMPGPVRWVRASGHKRVWFDVSNHDQVRLDLTFADGREASFIHSDVAAALKPKWYVLGTRGALVGDWRRETLGSRGLAGELIEDRLAPADAPAALRLIRPDGHGAAHEELISLPPRRPQAFYRDLADHLHFGESLAAPAEQARRTVAILEAASASLARGGRPVAPDGG